MGGVPGAGAAKVVVIGAGVSGMNAAEIALGMQADVWILDKNVAQLRQVDRVYRGHAQTITSNLYEVEKAVLDADLVIGAVLVPGAKAPTLVSNDLVARMRAGRCSSTSPSTRAAASRTRVRRHTTTRPTGCTTRSSYCVANMPGAVPHTSTYALTNVTLPTRWSWRTTAGVQRWQLTRRSLSASTPTTAASPTARSPRRTPWSPSTSPRCWLKVSENRLERSVRGYLDHLAVERGLATNTLASYSRDLPLRGLPGRAGSPGSGRDRRAGRQRVLTQPSRRRRRALRLGASSAARAVVAVRGLHRFLLREGLAPGDPAIAVRPPTPPRRLPKAISLEHVERPGGRGRRWYSARLRTGRSSRCSTGRARGSRSCRPGPRRPRPARRDAAAWEGWKAADRARGSYARDAVEAYLVRARPQLAATGRSTPALFLNARGGRLSRQSAWTVLRTVAGRAQLATHISPHTLRHLRDPLARRRRRRAGRSGVARPCVRHDHPDLHPGHGRPAARGVRSSASTGCRDAARRRRRSTWAG